MPWLETDPMNERKRFILEATGGLFSHTELCLRHGVSRKTGYKWLERYESEGPDGLVDRPHQIRAHPHTTEPYVVDAALELRGQRRRWGADKIRARLLTLHPDWSVPSARILHKYFLREGLVKKPRRLPYRLQPDPSSRSPRPEAACFRLSTLDPLVPDEAEHTRLPCSLRSPQSLKEWRYPMALPLDQRLSPARWRLHRSRRDRPRHLGRLLWPRLARLAAHKKRCHPRPRWLLFS